MGPGTSRVVPRRPVKPGTVPGPGTTKLAALRSGTILIVSVYTVSEVRVGRAEGGGKSSEARHPFTEAITAFDDPFALVAPDAAHSTSQKSDDG